MATKHIVVKNKNELYAIQNHDPDEIVLCTDTREVFAWDEEKGWLEIKVSSNNLEFNLYDLNKNIINQLDPLIPDEITIKMGLVEEYYDKSNSVYHMLLCKDFNYYTVFAQDPVLSYPNFASAISEIIIELGEVYSIELLEDGAMEIWIKPTGEESSYAFYLFPYDAGVVYYG